MGKRGPAPTPTTILTARGSWLTQKRKDAEPPIEPLDCFPPPPPSLSETGRAFWTDITAQLMPRRILTEADLAMLGVYCDLLDQYWNGGDKLKLAPLVRGYAQEFGLTPSARTRVRVEKKSDDATKAAKFLKIAKPR